MILHGHEVSPSRDHGDDLFPELWTRKGRSWSPFLEEIKAVGTEILNTFFSVTQPLHQRARPETYPKEHNLCPRRRILRPGDTVLGKNEH